MFHIRKKAIPLISELLCIMNQKQADKMTAARVTTMLKMLISCIHDQ